MAIIKKLKEKKQELAVKNLYLPYVIEDKCPNCGKMVTCDLRTYGLDYPVPNYPFKHHMYCGDGCEHEWPIKIVLRISVELAQ